MQAEQVEIAQFLAQHPPFDDLPTNALNELAQQVEVAYYRSQTDILTLGQDIADLFIIRSGSVEIYRRNNELYNRLDVGGIFGQMGLLMNRKVRFPAKALEDTLVYCINFTLFNRFCDEFDGFADYFEADGNVRLRQALVEQADSNDLTTAKVKSLIHRDVVTLS
ncbi:MAG TPA: cyclic nucleotide-binding protein, partial [Pseudoalteromonas sp.]|nr:cyclic nucleotide-binding protein [Pseudoalteromonas sp.]